MVLKHVNINIININRESDIRRKMLRICVRLCQIFLYLRIRLTRIDQKKTPLTCESQWFRRIINLLTINGTWWLTQWYSFELLVICIGKYGDVPRMPVFPRNKGEDVYKGKVLHTMDYSKLDKEEATELLRGKKVAIVGYKKSAIDLAVECAEANQGKTCYICCILTFDTTCWVPRRNDKTRNRIHDTEYKMWFFSASRVIWHIWLDVMFSISHFIILLETSWDQCHACSVHNLLRYNVIFHVESHVNWHFLKKVVELMYVLMCELMESYRYIQTYTYIFISKWWMY